jgi:AcrR family transcriptional regulator
VQADAATAGTTHPTRRERVREATLLEIKEIARRHLVAHGPPGVSLRAIAREMGMTAPGLYRYFGSHDELMLAMQADYFTELADAVRAADASLPPDDVDGRIHAALRAFRRWALANRAEFALLFGPPGPHHGTPEGPAVAAGQEFAAVFFTLFDRLLAEERFAVPDDDALTPVLCRQLTAFAEHTGFSTAPPLGALHLLTSCWVRLYGVVCMEVFHHLGFIGDDVDALFEAELRGILAAVGVPYRVP